MNDVRGWVQGKLIEKGYSSRVLPKHQLQISRDSRPDARVLCVGLGTGQAFDADDLDTAVEDVPGTGFVVVVPTRITHAAYERAEDLGVCVTGFGELLDALQHDEDITQHVDSQEKYERNRLIYNKAVESVKRKGRHAYEIRRKNLRPLTIVTTNNYEFTAEQLYDILASYRTIAPDLIVVTNPNCGGFSTDSMSAATQTGIPIVRFFDFLDCLGTEWT
ncbi:hypothetical protein [Streptomyces durhamensis]|uniref:hypothetical protein n=1 Tax=Streptomyces durhamensis TaxID=68194 RepID=UPI0012FEE51A|nr:hypothetical protein [Streptomyces durhamensis]